MLINEPLLLELQSSCVNLNIGSVDQLYRTESTPKRLIWASYTTVICFVDVGYIKETEGGRLMFRFDETKF